MRDLLTLLCYFAVIVSPAFLASLSPIDDREDTEAERMSG